VRTFTGAVLILLIGLFQAGCERGSAGPPPRPEVGVAAPAFGGVTLAGDSLRLADLEGGPILLNLWATWCPPCRTEIPFLQSLHEEFGSRGLQVVGVSVDGAGNRDRSPWRQWLVLRSYIDE